MSLSLDRESRFTAIGRWGMESGGLRATSALVFALATAAFGSTFGLWTGLRYDPIALGVTFCALEISLMRGLLLSVGIGYIGELFLGRPHGLGVFGAAVSYGLLRLIVFRVVGARAPTVAGLAGLAAIGGAAARGLLAASEGGAVPELGEATITTLVTAVVAYPAYRGYRFVSDRFRPKEDALFR